MSEAAHPPHPETPLWRRPKRWLGTACVIALVCLILSLLPAGVGEIDGRPVGHWSSLLPPLIAVILALAFRSLVFALTSAFLLGVALMLGLPAEARGWTKGAADSGFFDTAWWLIAINLTEQFQVYIFGFLFCLVGLIYVTYRSGGIQGMVGLFTRFARGPRSAKVTAFVSGLVVFFDDYSNTVVVGNTMRALTDRFRISREKLAYIVDSTTAPIAGIALVSTWIAFEVFLLGAAASDLGMDTDGYSLFLQLLPYRFYCYGALMLVLLTALTNRDFGPMLKAEQRAVETGQVSRPGARLMVNDSAEQTPRPEDHPGLWLHAVFPIGLVLLLIPVGILLVGSARAIGWGWGSPDLTSLKGLRTAFGAAAYDIYDPDGPGVMLVLFLAAIIGSVPALLLPVARGLLRPLQALGAFGRALLTLRMALFIIVMAWSMQDICKSIGTDTYLISLLGDRLPLWLLPLLTFVVASGMSFSMGSSWATMGILIPVILPLAHALGAAEPATLVIFFLTGAAVLDGAIFGDHCSPISDTTVLSSISSGCDHIDHVATQGVYALTVMAGAALLGYLPTALGWPGWSYFLTLPLALLALLWLVGRVPRVRAGA
ncbi:MAG: Na+/H+ antiporter NhaC family protein [Opitutales bacterium]